MRRERLFYAPGRSRGGSRPGSPAPPFKFLKGGSGEQIGGRPAPAERAEGIFLLNRTVKFRPLLYIAPTRPPGRGLIQPPSRRPN
ncbi:MAG: hypothetical protein DBY09_06155 [Selenomonadales bacterium]|nr:MAG: hypothetical protein DBY09_06155 [Selenomonadales bacterium]